MNDERMRGLTPQERLRFDRQIGPGVLTEEGQVRLRQSTVLVTRVGGMGGPCAMMLAMAGVGRILLAHSGRLESPDLNRQVLGREAGLDAPRAVQFAQTLRELSRFVEVEPIDHEPTDEEALAWAERCDLICACPPTFEERLRLNRAAVARGIPLIDAAQWGMTGTLFVVRPGVTACLACAYPTAPPFEEKFPVVGAISAATGSLAALEAIKILSGCGQPAWGRMLIYEGQRARVRQFDVQRSATCPVCAGRSSEA